MILTGPAIAEAVKKGEITISPFCNQQINPNSYNYRLGEFVHEIAIDCIDPLDNNLGSPLEMQSDGSYLLLPNKLYLGNTMELIGSEVYVTSLLGRSSTGRLGLFVQVTADLGQLGSPHRWTLELKVVSPLKVYPGMAIGQLSFWQAQGQKTTYYRNRYTAFNEPTTTIREYI